MADRVTASVSGDDEIRRNLEKIIRAMPRAIARGIYLAANNIMADSKRRVPVDLGVLRASGYVTLPEDYNGTLTSEIGYGGPAEDYAVVQHEHTEYYHPDGQAKFLESVVDEQGPRVSATVARIAKDALVTGNASPPVQNPAMPISPWETAAVESLGTAFRAIGRSVGLGAPARHSRRGKHR